MTQLLSPVKLAWSLLFTVCFVDLCLCPYTKVEESFPLQATHDLYYHGLTPAWRRFWHDHDDDDPPPSLPYDHVEYPGVVPRSFAAPLVLAVLCRGTETLLIRPLMMMTVGSDDEELRPRTVQFLVRFWCLLLYAHGWYRLAVALEEDTTTTTPPRTRRPRHVGAYALCVTACQFHLTFYASRPLPNVLATIACLHGYAAWTRRDGDVTVAAATFVTAATVLRCDVLLLLFTAGLCWLIRRQLTVLRAIRVGVLTGVVALGVTVPLDTVLWWPTTSSSWPVWPEGHVFYYNAVLGRSEHWGVMPWHWYLTSALPKALLGTAPLIPLAVWRWPERLSERTVVVRGGTTTTTTTTLWCDAEWIPYGAALCGYVALYSCLGHKEVRFLFPVLPLANVLAGAGLARLHAAAWPHPHDDHGKKDDDAPSSSSSSSSSSWMTISRRLAYLAAVGLLVLSFVASTVFVAVSRRNYPGGHALEYLAAHLSSSSSSSRGEGRPCRIYIDNAAAMTGVSLFGQRTLPSHCVVVKAGYEADRAQPVFHTDDDHHHELITHLVTEDVALGGSAFEVMATVPGHPRLNARHLRIDTSDALYVLKRTRDDASS